LVRLEPRPEPDRFAHVRALLRVVRDELHGELPVIVFAGAPFTVASYCIATGKNVQATQRFAAEQPRLWNELLDRLTTATIHFLSVLVRDGADIFQLFDSWAGLLAPEDYGHWAQKRHEIIFAAISEVPRILFVKECPYLDKMACSGAEVISLGQRHDLAAARLRYPHLVFQGNVDAEILRCATPDVVTAATRRCVREGGGRCHIVNLNHGVASTTPVANFEAFVQAARSTPLSPGAVPPSHQNPRGIGCMS
jgi:uroporphyrinogen decarboxylase